MEARTISAKVGVLEVKDSVQETTRQVMELAGWRKFITPGADVALKVNLGWDMFLPGAVSAPWVVEGVIQTIREHVGQIYIVDSNQILVDAERALRQTKIADLCQKYGVLWVNMSQGQFVKIKLNGLVLKEIEVPQILMRTEMITLPVMKTHGRAVITGAVKNQWGCLRELRHNYHPVLDQALADINGFLRPKFAVMDGTVGLEGNGPKSGVPKIADLVLASGDIVALDTVAAQIMGFRPEDIPHLHLCAQKGIGHNDPSRIEIAGVDIDQLGVRFQAGRNNTVALVEKLLRRSTFKRLVFETPLLNFFCWGAKAWYFLWYYYKGRRYRDQILADPKYGPQWM